MEEVTLQHTTVTTEASHARFSCNNEHIFLWGKGVRDRVGIQKRRVSDLAIVRDYSLPHADYPEVTVAPAADCFAVQIEDKAHVFVGAAENAFVIHTGAPDASAFSWDDIDSGRLVFAVVNDQGGQIWIENVQSRTHLEIVGADNPTNCAFSPDGRCLLVVCNKEIVTLAMDQLHEMMKKDTVALLRSVALAPAVRCVNIVDALTSEVLDMRGMLTGMTANVADVSFSADSSRAVLRHHGRGGGRPGLCMSGVTVLCMSSITKITRANVEASQAAFLDKKGRFVSMVCFHAAPPSITVWDTQTNKTVTVPFGPITYPPHLRMSQTRPHVAMSRTGDLVFSADWPVLFLDEGAVPRPAYPQMLTTINYRPAKIADDDGFDPDIAFEGIKNAAKLS